MSNTSNFFSLNLKHLRNRDKLSQQELADILEISRGKLNSYENEIATNPPVDLLINTANHFKINIDALLRKNLAKVSETSLRFLNQEYIEGKSLRVLATTVNSNNIENIELVPIKAKAGYANGYHDPEFISTLPAFQLPFLSQNKKYRAFQIDGDSMLPIKHGTYIIAEYVTDWLNLKSNQACIIITESEGVVFKIVHNQIKKDQTLQLQSLNPLFKTYSIPIQQVKEVWQFINYMSADMPMPQTSTDQILDRIIAIEKKLQ